MKTSMGMGVILAVIVNTVSASQITGVDRVQIIDKKVVLLPARTVLAAPNSVGLPFRIVVYTNRTFQVNGGKLRELEEGDVLGSNGMLLKLNGTITPVMDHLTLNRGRVLIVKDGEATRPGDFVELGNGTTVAPDWKITPLVGNSRRLMDGELFRLESGTIPARDTITMQDGRVFVQKDGSMLSLDRVRSIMMNDGTKVLSDGTVIYFNGTRSMLAEGEVRVIEGVVRRSR